MDEKLFSGLGVHYRNLRAEYAAKIDWDPRLLSDIGNDFDTYVWDSVQEQDLDEATLR